VIIMRAEIPGGMQLFNKSLPAGCYLQNAEGKFITCAGAVSATKILRPTTPELAREVGCPETIFARDGAYFEEVFRKFDKLLTRPINRINEDGEIFVSLGQAGKCAGDPKVKAAFDKFNASQSGAGTWETYASKWRVRLTTYFRDEFLKATPPIKALDGCHYSEYQVQGSNPYFVRTHAHHILYSTHHIYIYTHMLQAVYTMSWRSLQGAYRGAWVCALQG
jgi:hypothetical protein